MRSPRLTSYAAAVAALLLAAGSARAGGQARIDLPELTGPYVYSQLTFRPPGSTKTATLDTAFDLWDVTWVRFVMAGTVAPGLARGDGVRRPPDTWPINNGLGLDFGLGYSGYGRPQIAQSGAFTYEMTFDGPFDDHVPMGPPGSRFLFGATIDAYLGPTGPWADGFEVVTPATAEVTEAYLVLGGPGVPEPATLALLAAGALLLLRRRRGP